MLINVAVDETLARAIFRVIRDTSPKSVFRELRLEVSGAADFGTFDFDISLVHIIEVIGRKFLCRKSPRDDCTRENGYAGAKDNDMIVQELGLPKRGELEEYVGLWEYEDVFRGIWKEKKEKWTKDWSSFPLASP
jgi:hypothetical protein